MRLDANIFSDEKWFISSTCENKFENTGMFQWELRIKLLFVGVEWIVFHETNNNFYRNVNVEVDANVKNFLQFQVNLSKWNFCFPAELIESDNYRY